ncbi:hypothetical protein SAMN05421784_1402 [Xenorhabdus koppenhoeferi]|uniref:Uncharacterized protein n=1 Tax=Xenorhabdus koppenhoeferi TaxID=351659 RepID=A0A1I7JVT1_9GAMM|nr:hypothetical protein SAMN05421784_1402 [Xenorhabdus koppenhoeferi]
MFLSLVGFDKEIKKGESDAPFFIFMFSIVILRLVLSLSRSRFDWTTCIDIQTTFCIWFPISVNIGTF